MGISHEILWKKVHFFFHIFKLFFRFCVICFNDKMVSYTETYFQLI